MEEPYARRPDHARSSDRCHRAVAAVADQASRLANDSAGTFRELSTTFASLNIFGVQPLAGIAPQFSRSADQLQQLAISLGTTRDALGQNRLAIERVGGDLGQLQTQLDSLRAQSPTAPLYQAVPVSPPPIAEGPQPPQLPESGQR